MKELGIDPLGLIAQLFNVGLLLFIFKRFLEKPILRVLERRRQLIEDNIRLEERLEAKLEALDEKEKQLLKRAKVRALKISEEARAEARASSNAMLSEAREETKNIRKQAIGEIERQLETERKKLEKLMSQKAAALANDALVKILDEKTRRQLTAKQVEAFQKPRQE